jgi:hypothetical protein
MVLAFDEEKDSIKFSDRFSGSRQIGSSAILPVKLKQFVGVVQFWLAFPRRV